MIGKKIAVDGAATAESVLDGVPESDTGFAQLPTQVDFLVTVESWKIDQSGFDIFQLATNLLNLFDDGFKSARRAVLVGSKAQNLLAGSDHAAGQGNALSDGIEVGVALFVFLFGLN